MPEDWQAESLRLTLFPGPHWEPIQADWWTKLLGEPPEKKTVHPKTGDILEEGPFEGDSLVFGLQRDRIDWLLTASTISNQATLGTFKETTERFSSLMLRWLELEDSPAAKRIAFGAVLLQEVDTKEEGYKKLCSYLRLIGPNLEGASDFLYQVNRTRDFKLSIRGPRINRLSKWCVALREGFEVSAGAEDITFRKGARQFACRLELDINTDPNFEGELKGPNLVEVFDELVRLGKEISQHGDIK